MIYSECVSLIRDRLQASSVDTLADAAIDRTFDSVYIQWWERFGTHAKSITTSAMPSTGILSLNGDAAFADDATITDILSVLAGTSVLARVPLAQLKWLIANASGAAGFSTAAGTAEYYAVGVTPATSATVYPTWTIYTFPTSTSTLTVKYKKLPVRGSAITTAAGRFECSEDVVVGLCAITALRLMAAVGKQNDQGLIQTLISEVPQEMQAMAFPAKHGDVLPMNPPEGN